MAKNDPPPASIQALTAEATLMSRLQGLPEEELKDILETMWGNAKIEYATMPDGNTGVRVYSGTSTKHDPADLKGARLFSPSESAANAHAEKYGGKTRVTSEVIPMMSAVSGAKVQSGVGEKFGYGYEIELNKQGQVVTPTKRSTKEIGLLSGTTPTIAQKFAPGPKTPGMTIDPKTAIDFEDTRDLRAKSVEDIAAASETSEDIERRVAREKAESLSQRRGTGSAKNPFAKAIGPLAKIGGPLLGLTTAGLLAPNEAWALDKPALDYWGSAATGLDFGKFREDYSAALSDDAKQQWQDSMDFYGGLAGDASQLVSDVLGTADGGSGYVSPQTDQDYLALGVTLGRE